MIIARSSTSSSHGTRRTGGAITDPLVSAGPPPLLIRSDARRRIPSGTLSMPGADRGPVTGGFAARACPLLLAGVTPLGGPTGGWLWARCGDDRCWPLIGPVLGPWIGG
jgi:hypothetical protein